MQLVFISMVTLTILKCTLQNVASIGFERFKSALGADQAKYRLSVEWPTRIRMPHAVE